jgi:S-adenosylmethionine-dependent methyltransferase
MENGWKEELAKRYDLLAEEYDDEFHSDLEAKIRNQVIFSTLQKFITKKPSKILDAGGGTGFYSIPFAVKGHDITLLDISEKMLEKARRNAEKSNVSKRVKTVRGDMDHLDFPNSYFDVVLCHLAFEYVSKPLKTLREFYRVLKKDGLLSLTVVNKYSHIITEILRGNFSEAERILQVKNFFVSPRKILPKIRTFTKGEIVNLCRDANFNILQIKGLRVMFDYLPKNLQKTGLLEKLEMRLSEIEDLSSISRHIYLVCKAE